MNFVDYHSHILPQVDDGSIDYESAIETAAILASAGFAEISCTPHMLKGIYENDPADIRDRTLRLREILEQNSIRLKLTPGAEYCLDEHLPAFFSDPLPLASCHVLAETPLQTSIVVLESLIDMLIARGFTPLIAHPERTPLFSVSKSSGQKNTMLSQVRKLFNQGQVETATEISQHLTVLLGKGCRLQGNIGSFAGLYGSRVQNNALQLLDKGLYSCLGSDAHRPEHLEEILKKGIASIRNRIGSDSADRLLRGELLTAAP